MNNPQKSSAILRHNTTEEMSGQQRKVHGEHTASSHNMSGQHRQHLHNPTGYTDEVAEEEREFIMQAERTAVCPTTPHKPNNTFIEQPLANGDC
jgi:hypothetical protein